MRERPATLCAAVAMLILLSSLPETATAQEAAEKAAGGAAAQASEKQTGKDARQAQIAADTERLFKMAQELKAEVAKSNKDILSVAVVKKADEIEKLAKSLKERMRAE
jgi:hypothetical protein